MYDVIETDKYIGIILEYASGGELFDHILAHRYLKEKDACKLFSQLISGVCYIHEKKIVHRDLKLENLLLDRHRNVIITDFGFANRFEHRADDLMQTSCGSPCYAAPELVISEGLYVGSAVDIWSCGVILYAMLAGYLPFDDDPANPDGDNINLLYRYIVNTPLTFPEYVSDEARHLLGMMLVPDPKKRADIEGIKAHPWLKPYSHLFERSVEDLERLAMEQHQMKRLAYQRQMRQQAAAAAEQTKIQRSQSARVDAPIGATGPRSRHHPPSSMNPEYLYESTPDEPLFTTAPPHSAPPPNRRHAASAVVVPTINNQIIDDDPFAPSPTVSNNNATFIKMGSPGEDAISPGGEPRSRRSKESTGGSRTPRKAVPATNAAAKSSPERERRKADRQRHTIQLEYGGDEPEEMPRPPKSSRARQQQQDAEIVDNGVIIGDAINPGSTPPSAGGSGNTQQTTPKVSARIDRHGSTSRGSKPLPTPPSAHVGPPGAGTGPKRSTSIPKSFTQEQMQDASVLASVENQTTPKLPTVNVAPASPPRMENLPPSAYEQHQEKVNIGKGVSGSISSNGSGSSKHRRGMSMDKFVGKLWYNTGSDAAEAGAYTNGIGKGAPSEAQITMGQRMPSEKGPSPRPSTLQVSSASHSTAESKETDKNSEGKKSRRNTLTVMVEPLAKLGRQRTKNRAAANEAAARKEQAVTPVVGSNEATDTASYVPTGLNFPTQNAAPVSGTPGTNIPASTSKASKVMQWFRSKSRTPSTGPPPERFEEIPPEEQEDRSATPTAGHRIQVMAASSTETVNQAPQVVVTTPNEKGRVPQAPAMGFRSSPTTGTETSFPPTSHVASRALGVLSSLVTSPGSSGKGTFNKNAMRVHHGAVDQTTVTTGSPPDVMKHVTKVLLDMGLEVEHESEYKYRCVRPKRRKVSGGVGGSGLAAFTMTGSAASNGVSVF